MPRYHLTTVIEADSESAVRQSWIDGEIGAIVEINLAEAAEAVGIFGDDAIALVAHLHCAFSLSQDFGDTFDIFGRLFERAGFGYPTEDQATEMLEQHTDELGCVPLALLQPWWPATQRGVQREAG